MTTTTQTKMTLIDRVKDVIADNDSAATICNKIITKYPEVLKLKMKNSTEKLATAQLIAEIQSQMGKIEDKLFIINRNTRPYQYSFISIDIDDDECDDPIIDLTNPKTEEELDIGHIYIIDTHLQFNNKEIVKIGVTKNIDRRLKELNGEQSSYQKHTILYQFKVTRQYKIESAIHRVLDQGRINPGKEGFYKEYVEENIDLIKQMIKLFEID